MIKYITENNTIYQRPNNKDGDWGVERVNQSSIELITNPNIGYVPKEKIEGLKEEFGKVEKKGLTEEGLLEIIKKFDDPNSKDSGGSMMKLKKSDGSPAIFLSDVKNIISD